jgi:16S rRNA (uracil1498-N3)-methyltransferase
MHRFFVSQINDDQVEFSEHQSHQIDKVLRMQPGDRVVALDNAGWEYEAALKSVARKRVTAVILAKNPITNEPAVDLTLFQSVLKRDKFEWVLQKCTEIGVVRFVPLITERTVARVPKQMTRWQRILIESAEQSGRGKIPELSDPQKLFDAFANLPEDQTALIPWEQAEGRGIRDALVDEATAVSLFIGPEGGFTKAEISQAKQHEVIPVSLGRRILRSETAAIVASSLVFHVLGELV